MSGVLESGDTVAEAIRPTLDKFVAGAAPYLKKATDELYEQLLNGVQDYLRENGEWNIGQEIDRCRTIETNNRQLRDINADLMAGCNGLLGLLALVRVRDDLAPDLREALTGSYRVKEAEAAIARATGATS